MTYSNDDEANVHDWEDPDLADQDSDDTIASCPYCGEEVFDDADVCPHCRNFIAWGEEPVRRTGRVVVLILAAAVMIGFGSLMPVACHSWQNSRHVGASRH